eukprot:ANDGO_06724.mRNA.1 Retrovirus-related Pol polyprotein from transposon TNT 1-94
MRLFASMNQQDTVEKFGGDDYHLSSVKLKMLLMPQGLWDVVVCDKLQPQDSQRACKALGIMGMALKDSVLVGMGFHAIETPREAWDKLAMTYGKKSTVRKLLSRQQLQQVVMQEGEDVQKYIAKVNGLVDELSLAGVAISSEDVVAKMLLGLPKSWSSLVAA